MNKSKRRLVPASFIIAATIFLLSHCNPSEKKSNMSPGIIKYLEKTGEIKTNFLNDSNYYFLNIVDFCSDGKNYFYVADNGWNKIFKFNNQGQYISCFGNEGQGPGEFLAEPGKNFLKMSFGNDGNIYIYDSGNRRISVFNRDDEHVKDISLPHLISDAPMVNSKGDMYFIFNDGFNAIHCLDKNLQSKGSFLSSKLHFKSKFFNPTQLLNGYIRFSHIRKVMTKDDHIIALSNFALQIFHFDESNNLISTFRITHRALLKDLKKRFDQLLDKERSLVVPFDMFLDQDENICLIYSNYSIKNWEIYRYRINGVFFDIIRFPERVSWQIYVDEKGNFYASYDGTQVIRYEIK